MTRPDSGAGQGASPGASAGRDASSGDGAGSDADSGAGSVPRARSGRGRVVISSVTGEPITWEDEEHDRPSPPPSRRPILPDTVSEDEPEPGADESNDSRLAGDVPPHWGRGR